MAAPLESVILKLLQNTTNEGQVEGFREIQGLFKDPTINISLCQCVTQSQDPQVRRYASLLLRRRVLKSKHWKRVPPDVKQGMKATILEAYIKDTDKTVRNALAELIAAIAKHDLPTNQWPELMALLSQSIRSNNNVDREVGLYSLSVITKALGDKLKPHFKSLLNLFQSTLVDMSSIDIPYYTIKCLTHMVCSIGTEELNIFQALIPNIINIIKALAPIDQAKACESLEIFDELLESEVAVLQPHLKGLVELCLMIASTDKFDADLRIKAVHIISYLIKLKKKSIIKQRLAQPMLEVLFPLMCQPCPGDTDDVDYEELEISLPSAAGQALDIMALHLPPTKLMPLIMQYIKPAFGHPNPHHRKAAFLALSVIAEGCSEYIREKYLPSFLPIIEQGVKDPDSCVCNSALYAIGQYAEYLQPDISKFAPQILPVLFEFLQQTCVLLQQGHKKPPSLVRTFYAVERFCENLEDIKPYLPNLMHCLTTFLTINTENSVTVKELAVESIGSVASSAKTEFVPYFQPVMEHLQRFIADKHTEETRPLQIQAIDTLAIIARSVGAETFKPVAHECVKCAIHLMMEVDDPDVRRSCYTLISSISCVLHEEMAPYLPTVIERMITTLKSNEEISVTTDYDKNNAFTLFEDGEEEETENGDMSDTNLENLEGDDEEDDDITGYSVENSYVDEKESVCVALKEISAELKGQFLTYLEACYEEVKKLVEHLSDDLRRTAIAAMGQFCITLNDIHVETSNLECRVALEKYLNMLFPKLFSLAREDTENGVVLACLETLQNVIDNIKQPAIYGGNLESICLLIRDVFQNKLACQDEADGDEDDQEAEYDGLILEYAGELIASLIKVTPWAQFAPYFAGLMPFLINKSKKACTVSEKSFSTGTLADIVSNMEARTVKPFISHLQPVFLGGMRDENEEVRSNSVYGLGVLAENAKELVFDQYPTYLQALSNMIASEEDRRTKDNVCGAIARLIKTNPEGVPLDQVFPVFLQYLPLKEDQEENSTVFECLVYLHSMRYKQLFENLPQLVKISSETLMHSGLKKGAIDPISSLLNNIYKEFPNDFDIILKSLPSENVEAIMKVRAVV
uniref:Importin-4 n=1 Tax=Parasteatoda tepidariorum TaxID=114398 RepID=A0A2L2Y6J1_PARTP